MTTEAVVQQQVRLAMARAGAQLWRNNVGCATDDTGRLIRYGICNDSAQLNATLKSSDLLGITPVTVTPEMVGMTIGVFTALECKRPGWHLTPGDQRGQAQKRFIDLVRGVGGVGGFVTDVSDLAAALRF
jgi:hypothetical protein